MREIKFRVWDKTLKIMRIPTQLSFHGNGEYKGFWVEGSAFSRLDIYELMQFTGLKDKNGKEIYEGDIIKGLGNISDSKRDKHVISFREGSFGCAIINRHGYELKYAWFPTYITFKHKGHEIIKDVEVIGNIYENPELLK